MTDPLLAFDKTLGGVVERLVRSHHHRRLRKIGWEHALEPPDDRLWTAGGPAPRAGNAIEVLVDGAEALPRIAAELRKARSHVRIAGWYVSPWFDLTHDGTKLTPLLADLAERVDVGILVWAGSPLPLFRPDREDVDGVRHAITLGTRIRFAADAKERPMHCHHEKLVVIDDRVAFVGDIDLTTYEGDRWDTSEHVARGCLGWQDAAVMLRGPIVADVAEHFRFRWREIENEELPEPKRQRRASVGAEARVPREPVLLVERDRGDPRGQVGQIRRPTTSASCSCFPRTRTTVPMTRAGSSRTCSSATAS